MKKAVWFFEMMEIRTWLRFVDVEGPVSFVLNITAVDQSWKENGFSRFQSVINLHILKCQNYKFVL
jgi:hypothetical protein